LKGGGGIALFGRKKNVGVVRKTCSSDKRSSTLAEGMSGGSLQGEGIGRSSINESVSGKAKASHKEGRTLRGGGNVVKRPGSVEKE